MASRIVKLSTLTTALLLAANLAVADDQDQTRDRTRDRLQDQTQEQARDQTRDRDRLKDQSRDQDQTRDRKRLRTDEPIYGSQLMTRQERIEHRNKLRSMKTEQEREAYREEHHKKMQERAKARGITLPDEPPARGGMMGPGGGGMGPGGGMMAPRR